ncbi:MAG: hypothetical protein KDB02_02240 [Acidimicrobiales bacterium]|nr:hypothetical protein [Acidimicrobiales bacterium]
MEEQVEGSDHQYAAPGVGLPSPTAAVASPGAFEGDRPRPRYSSLLGAVAGLLLAVSLAEFLSSLSGDGRRLAGIAIALVFEFAGVGLVWLAREKHMATAGIALSAIGLVPLVFHLFVDPADPGASIGSVSEFTGTATGILAVLTVLWLAAYFLGPGRRYGVYLGGALVAIWLIAMVQIVDDPLTKVENQLPVLGRTESFQRIDSDDSSSSVTTDDSGFSADSTTSGDFEIDGNFDSSTEGSFDFDSDIDSSTEGSFDFDSDFDSSSTDSSFDLEESGGGDGTMTKLGAVSLLLGAAYLAVAALRDRRGDMRMATAFVAVSIPILHLAVLMLSESLEAYGTGLLAIGLGACAILVGEQGARRFTSWSGVWAVTVGVVVVVEEATGASSAATATILMVLGAALAAFLYVRETRPPSTRPPAFQPLPQPSPTPPTVHAPGIPPIPVAPPVAPSTPPQVGPSPFAPPADAADWGPPSPPDPPSPGS